MMQDTDFTLFMKGYRHVTLNVVYYMPDHRSVLNEFIWQTLDLRPTYPRVQHFLEHWRREIDAVIKEVLLSDSDAGQIPQYRRVIDFKTIQ